MHTKRNHYNKCGLWRLLLVCFLLLLLQVEAEAKLVKDDCPVIEGAPSIPMYLWRDDEVSPRGVALAVHGLIMHGGTYDRIASELAGMGFIVVAPDLRGYGRWLELEKDSGNQSARACVEYEKSFQDLCQLGDSLRRAYPELPLYGIGESLGAGMALRLAAERPEHFSGLILSSPAIKRKSFYFAPRMLLDLVALFYNPWREVQLDHYISRWASEDPEIAQLTIQDPLVRKRLRLNDLWKTARFIRNNIEHAKKLPDDLPILVIQGDRDMMVKSEAVHELVAGLKCHDKATIKWFSGKGHLLLETSIVEPETMSIIKKWLGNTRLQQVS